MGMTFLSQTINIGFMVTIWFVPTFIESLQDLKDLYVIQLVGSLVLMAVFLVL